MEATLTQKNEPKFQWVSQYGRLQKYVLDSSFKTARSYIYGIITPAIIFAGMYLVLTSFGSAQNNYFSRAWMLALLFIGPVFTIMGSSSIIMNWRESVIIKQIKVFNVSKWQIIPALWMNTLIWVGISYCSNIIIGCIIDTAMVNKNFLDALTIIYNFGQVISIIFALVLCSVISFSLAYIISFSLNSPLIIQTINVVIILYTFVLANFIDPNMTHDLKTSLILNILGYIDPFKSVQWMLVPSYVDVFSKSQNIIFAIWHNSALVPYSLFSGNGQLAYLYATIVTLLWITGLSTPIFFIRFNKI